MKTRIGLAVLLWLASACAFAQTPPAYLFFNRSSAALIDDATAKALFYEIVSPKLVKLYPSRNWGFVTQVQGGLTEDNTCVIAATVLMLPRNRPHTTDLLLFKPEETATTFGALPNASAAQCAELAKNKLRDAHRAMLATLVPH
jgi:hypothetical protein